MPRNLALKTLNDRENVPGFQERTLDGAFDENPRLDQRDRAFSLNLVQGVLRWQIKIDGSSNNRFISLLKASIFPY